MVTREEVLKILKTHSIDNNSKLAQDLQLASKINVKIFDPREYQLDLLVEILNKILFGKKYKIIVLELPTGYGKSYISEALSILLDYYEVSPISAVDKNITLTFRNNLFDQYTDSFKYMYSIKGKSNYTCLVDYAPVNSKTLCIKDSSNACGTRFMCEYYLQQSNFFKSKKTLTNYNWYIYNFNKLDLRSLTSTLTMDECHKFFNILDECFNPNLKKYHDVFMELCALRNIQYEDSDYNINLINHRYGLVLKTIEVNMEFYYADPRINADMINKLEGMKTDLGLLSVLEEYAIPSSLSKGDRVKAAFRKLALLNNPKKVKIIMSATISKSFFMDNLYDGDPDDVLYIHKEPLFPKENRKIFAFKGLPSVNFEKMNDPAFIDLWAKIIRNIIDHYAGKKGFVFVNSYPQVKLLISKWGKDPRLIFNDHPSNAKSSLEKYMNDKTDKVMISPLLIEGYDLKDDMSRFQILGKIPFTNHNIIKEYGESFYYNSAVTKLLQIYGRSIRHMDDYADTYLVDSGWTQLDKYLPQWFKDSIIFK